MRSALVYNLVREVRQWEADHDIVLERINIIDPERLTNDDDPSFYCSWKERTVSWGKERWVRRFGHGYDQTVEPLAIAVDRICRAFGHRFNSIMVSQTGALLISATDHHSGTEDRITVPPVVATAALCG